MTSSMALRIWPTSGVDDIQAVIRAVYKQVLGNPHVMDSERLVGAESRLCEGTLTVREFVREVAKSELYRNLYFSSCAPYRFVELNFMHLLGRAPQDQREASEHLVRVVAEGFDAEIDSYVNSDEYLGAFGEDIVPYYRGKNTEATPKMVCFNRTLMLDRGPAQLDSAVKASQLVYDLGTNRPTSAIRTSTTNVLGSGTEKRFKIVVSGSKFDNPRRKSSTEYIVPASRVSPQLQRINRTSGRIVSITEIT